MIVPEHADVVIAIEPIELPTAEENGMTDTDAQMVDRADSLRQHRGSHSARIGFALNGEPFVVPATVTAERDGRTDLHLNMSTHSDISMGDGWQ